MGTNGSIMDVIHEADQNNSISELQSDVAALESSIKLLTARIRILESKNIPPPIPSIVPSIEVDDVQLDDHDKKMVKEYLENVMQIMFQRFTKIRSNTLHAIVTYAQKICANTDFSESSYDYPIRTLAGVYQFLQWHNKIYRLEYELPPDDCVYNFVNEARIIYELYEHEQNEA